MLILLSTRLSPSSFSMHFPLENEFPCNLEAGGKCGEEVKGDGALVISCVQKLCFVSNFPSLFGKSFKKSSKN
jgi:hypothetical protein